MLNVYYKEQENKFHVTIFAVAVILLSSTLITTSLYLKGLEAREISLNNEKLLAKVTVIKEDPFKDISLIAKAAYVYDINSKKTIYSFNAEESLPLASLTKLMTALTAADLVPSYTVVKIKKEFLTSTTGNELYADEEWKLEDLINYSLLISSNEGSKAIASVVGAIDLGTDKLNIGREEFIRKMNVKAKEIGLTKTSFSNESGLDESSTKGGAYGSAKDVAILMQYISQRYPELISATKYSDYKFTSLDNIVHNGQNTNYEVGVLPGIIASKTGTTPLAGGNLVVVYNTENNHKLAISILGSTADGRYSDLKKLIETSAKYYEN